MSYHLVYVTCSSLNEAEKLGYKVVNERLVACVNIVDKITSIYRFEESIHKDKEVLLILKTKECLVETLTAKLNEYHQYENPCIISFKIDSGNKNFLSWISKETK